MNNKPLTTFLKYTLQNSKTHMVFDPFKKITVATTVDCFGRYQEWTLNFKNNSVTITVKKDNATTVGETRFVSLNLLYKLQKLLVDLRE